LRLLRLSSSIKKIQEASSSQTNSAKSFFINFGLIWGHFRCKNRRQRYHKGFWSARTVVNFWIVATKSC
jgi:hypothetical protein